MKTKKEITNQIMTECLKVSQMPTSQVMQIVKQNVDKMKGITKMDIEITTQICIEQTWNTDSTF